MPTRKNKNKRTKYQETKYLREYEKRNEAAVGHIQRYIKYAARIR